MKTPIERAAHLLGSFAALSRQLGVKPPAVHQWRTNGVPPNRCRAIEAATGGAVTCHELRPDVFGPAPDGERAA